MNVLQLSTTVPEARFSTEDLIDAFPCSLPEGLERNVLNLGVSQRYLVDHGSVRPARRILLSEKELASLSQKVCDDAIRNAGISTKDVGYFIATHDQSPILCPGLSQVLVREMGFASDMKHVNIQGSACGAFVKAMRIARDHLNSNPHDYVLVCISGVNSYWFYNQVQGMREIREIQDIKNIHDRIKKKEELRKWIAAIEFFLFGDGLAGVVLTDSGEGPSVGSIVELTNLDAGDYLSGYARLEALGEPFKLGIYSHLSEKIPELGLRYASAALERLKRYEKEPVRTCEKWAVHTGSRRILDLLAESVGVPDERLGESRKVLEEYGNLAGASLPFIAEKIISTNNLRKGERILVLGYGWGFSASATTLRIQH